MNHFNIVLALAKAALRGDAEGSARQAGRLARALSSTEPDQAEEFATVLRSGGAADFSVHDVGGDDEAGPMEPEPRDGDAPLASGPITDSVKDAVSDGDALSPPRTF